MSLIILRMGSTKEDMRPTWFNRNYEFHSIKRVCWKKKVLESVLLAIFVYPNGIFRTAWKHIITSFPPFFLILSGVQIKWMQLHRQNVILSVFGVNKHDPWPLVHININTSRITNCLLQSSLLLSFYVKWHTIPLKSIRVLSLYYHSASYYIKTMNGYILLIE